MKRFFSLWLKWSQQILLLPNLPKPSSFRETMADWVFIGLRFLAWYGHFVGALVGFILSGGPGFVFGILIGGPAGLWIRYSMALRKGNPTNAFFLRMHERAFGRKPRLLESLLELFRGNRLSVDQCRVLVSAYDGLRHHLQTCESDIERNRVLREFERNAFAAMYGQRAFPETSREMEGDQTRNLNTDV